MRLTLLIILGMALPSAPQATEITSVVTQYLNACTLTEKLEESGDEYYICPGYQDIGVTVLAGHDSNQVSFGPKAQEECAFRQSFTAHSTPQPSVEWRVKGARAFAAIQTWSVSRMDTGSQSDDWLVVTRLETGKTCQIAAIQASLPEAAAKARRKADERASGFDCQSDQLEIVAEAATDITELMNEYRCEKPGSTK